MIGRRPSTALAVEPPSARTASRSRLRNVVGLAVSALCLGAVVWWATRQDAPSFPTSPAEIALLGIALAVYALVTVMRGWRWHAIMREAEIPHRTSDAFALTVVCYMGNTVLPARGGEVLRLLLMAERSRARRREILGSILAERLLDGATLLVLFASLSLSGVAGSTIGRGLATIGLAIGGFLALAAGVVIWLRRQGRFARLAEVVRPVVRASRLLLGRLGVLLGFATFAIWALESIVLWLVAESLDVQVGFLEAAFLVALTSFAVALPAAPGYVGTLDAALIFGLAAFDVGGGEALSVALLWRFVLFVPVTIAGLILVIGRYGGFSRLRRTREAPSVC